MSLSVLETAIKDSKLICPKCNKGVKKYDNFVQTAQSVWDGAGDSGVESGGSKVTLICGNDPCSWKERTEYWDSYIDE